MTNDLLVKREGDFTYPICFRESFDGLAAEVEKQGLSGRRACIIADSNTAPLYLEAVTQELGKACSFVTSFVIPAGEENKNLDTVRDIYAHLIRSGLDRKSFLAALGGGVTGDMTGFAAATYLRGIDFIQIPTTLLSQVDSSVGGKTGVDFDQYKNMVGAFHQPRLVFMNMNTLRTLPREELISGMGEVLKTGLICDGDFFRYVCESRDALYSLDTEALSSVVRRCCEIKAQIVERDPTEQGERALLNLGHTLGHSIEKLKDFSLRHGQCVGVGLAAAAFVSLRRGLLTEEEYTEIIDGLRSFELPVSVGGLTPEAIVDAARKDKKAVNGNIRFILMDGIGGSFIDRNVTEEELLAAAQEVLR